MLVFGMPLTLIQVQSTIQDVVTLITRLGQYWGSPVNSWVVTAPDSFAALRANDLRIESVG